MKTFKCPDCDATLTAEYLDYDAFGAGCPHCGHEMTHSEINHLMRPEENQDYG
jgi:uncharacterized paraquat-inducible protein A